MSKQMVVVKGSCEYCGTEYDGEMVVTESGAVKCPTCELASYNWDEDTGKPEDYCEVGMSSCRCGWQGKYPVSGCPNCHTSFCC